MPRLPAPPSRRPSPWTASVLGAAIAAGAFTAVLVVPAVHDGGSVWAQTRYKPWQPPATIAQERARLESMLKKLDTLVTDAERARAADPRFLKDLRDLVDATKKELADNPVTEAATKPADPATTATKPADPEPREPKVLLSDDFQDGDFTDGPRWTVESGTFSVAKRGGLRSVVEAPPADEVDAALDILGKVLDDATGSQRDPKSVEPARILTSVDVPNAFTLTADIFMLSAKGKLELGLWQNGAGRPGYRLVLTAGADPALALVRETSRAGVQEVAAFRQPLALADRRFHRVQLIRGADKTLVVSVDGVERLRVEDTTFNDPFNGVVIINSLGENYVRSVSVAG